MNKDYQLTQEGYDELKQEADELISRRGELAEAIKVARDQGDLSENSEYHDAKDEQGRVESRISEINHILTNAKIIETSKSSEVVIGSTVTLENEKGKEVKYAVVSSVEANPLERKISDQSPIGKSLLGQKIGDAVAVELPAGTVNYKIKEIS
ncbi:TPA: transcription elongation factor GreA [Candidatus Saccharibacteria bacterium]|jgi:transcription elongation factor GreA|nr:transcription elongation factor GreA [Candidatus Saccharibacteria bacterium]HIO87231.1 transcription elongation factor GreA [Candidatus Saccharibacteria bacterium]